MSGLGVSRESGVVNEVEIRDSREFGSGTMDVPRLVGWCGPLALFFGCLPRPALPPIAA